MKIVNAKIQTKKLERHRPSPPMLWGINISDTKIEGAIISQKKPKEPFFTSRAF
ncbi:MAG: hypothetical protein ACOYK6_01930 [Chthoniobacterales bacterium]